MRSPKYFISLSSLLTLGGMLLFSMAAQGQMIVCGHDDSECIVYDNGGGTTNPTATRGVPVEAPLPPSRPAEFRNQSQQHLPVASGSREPQQQSGGSGAGTTTQEKTQNTEATRNGNNQNQQQQAQAESPEVDESKVQAAAQALETCRANAESTEGSCSTEKDSTLGMLMNAGDSIAQALGTANMAGTTGETCIQLANTTGAANSALGAIKGNCMMSYNTCSNSCKEAEKLIKELPESHRSQYNSQLSTSKKQCNGAQARIKGLEQNIAAAMQAFQRAKTCAQDAGVKSPTLEQCMANPSLAGCSLILPQDCTNPTVASTNLACICQASNGRDSRCGQANLSSTVPNSGAASYGESSMNDGTLGAAGIDGFGAGSSYEAPQVEPSRRSAQMPGPAGGGGGVGGGSSSGANQPRPRQAAGVAPSSINADIYSGFSGGRRGGGFGGGSGGSGSGASPAADPGWIPPKVTPNPNAINMDKFRPKDFQMNGRGVASNDVLPNGLLAPHIDIWKQVNSRYKQIMSTLTP